MVLRHPVSRPDDGSRQEEWEVEGAPFLRRSVKGFLTASTLATKLVTLFGVAAELLSRQQHYDWGLRAQKTSLGIAGRLLAEVCCRDGGRGLSRGAACLLTTAALPMLAH